MPKPGPEVERWIYCYESNIFILYIISDASGPGFGICDAAISDDSSRTTYVLNLSYYLQFKKSAYTFYSIISLEFKFMVSLKDLHYLTQKSWITLM